MSEYNSSSIKVLKGLEACRKRPGMYIGDIEKGSFQMIKEVLDNCIDEHLAQHCNHVVIHLTKDGYASISDNGRGMPVDIHPEEHISAAIVIMTQLHAGGKFDQNSYKVSGGLHGVGVSVVNALSDKLELTIYRDGNEHCVSFEKGEVVGDIKIVGPSKKTGTKVRFIPDNTILPDITFNSKEIEKTLQEAAFLNPGLKLDFIDEKNDKKSTFYEPNGLRSFVESLVKKETLSEYIQFDHFDEVENIKVMGGFLWENSYSENLKSFTNNIPQAEGGTHLIGFKTALTRCVNNYLEKEPNLAKKFKGIQISGDDIREGVVCVLSIYIPNPQFSSQTKEKLVSANARSVVEKAVTLAFEVWLEENPIKAKEIIDKIANACFAREAARKSREVVRNKSNLDNSLTFASKVAGCALKDPTKCELFIVEGESAGGSAKKARNRMYQAVLGLKGKILNVEKAGFHKMLNDESIRSLISVIGTNIGDNFDITKIKYNKIIIMADADVDGSHILTLIITFFFRYMRPIIENGYLYVAKPPLYGVKQGNKITYLKNDEALTDFLFQANLDKIKFYDNEELIDSEMVKKFLLALTTIGKDLKNRNIVYQALLANKICIIEDFNIELILDTLMQIKPGKWSYKEEKFIFELNGLVYKYDFNFDSIPKTYINFILNWNEFWGGDIKMQYGNSEAKVFLNPFDMYVIFTKKSSNDLLIERYKGLGEMDAIDLRETAMVDYDQVTIEDVEKAELNISNLMGDDVLPRKEFIEKLEHIETDDD